MFGLDKPANRRFAIISFFLALCWGGLGYWIGLHRERPLPDGTMCALRPPPVEDMAARNMMWRAANGDVSGPQTSEQNLGTAVSIILAPNELIPPELRSKAMTVYLQKTIMTFVNGEDAASQDAIIKNGSPEDRLRLLRRLSDGDSRSTRLLGQILKDQERLELLMKGRPVPLEKKPDGTVP